ncbi:MAG: GNVR domain-containing protein [Gemmatimonadaceae bacterium]
MADVVPFTELQNDGSVNDGRAEPLTLAVWMAGVMNRWRMVVASAAAVLALALLAAVVLPPVSRATVSFAPNPTSSSKLSGAMSSLGGLSGLAGGLGLGSAIEPSESPAFYTQLVQSRELLTRLLMSRFPDPRTSAPNDSARLVDIMKLRSDQPARRVELGVKALRKAMRAESDVKSNVINMTVDDRWPELAALEANRTLALVNSFNIEQRASRARSKRVYLQERLSDARGSLAAAQARYRDFLASNRQWRQSPTLSSDEENLRRGVDLSTDLYLSIEKQFETARMDEFNDAALITVVDSAVTPQRPEWPRYSILVPAAIMGGMILGILVAGVATVYADWTRREPVAARRLRTALRRSRDSRDTTPIARRA